MCLRLFHTCDDRDGCRVLPKNVFWADTIVVSCGLANFERVDAALSQIVGLRDELATAADHGKFLVNFTRQLPWSVRRSLNMDGRMQGARRSRSRREGYTLVEIRKSWSLSWNPRTTYKNLGVQSRRTCGLIGSKCRQVHLTRHFSHAPCTCVHTTLCGSRCLSAHFTPSTCHP